MRSAVLLLLVAPLVSLVLSDCWDPQDDTGPEVGVRTRRENLKSEQPSEPSPFWDELRGLKQMVLSLKAAEVGQRQVLRRTEARLRDRELEAEQHQQSLERVRLKTESDVRQLKEQVRALRTEADLQALQSRLNASEQAADDLKRRSAALAEALPFLQARLRASEATVVELKRKNADLSSRLCSAERGLEDLRKQSSPGSEPSPPGTRPDRLASDVAEVESRLRSTHARAEPRHSAGTASNSSSGQEAPLDRAGGNIPAPQNRTDASQLETGLGARLDRIGASLRGLEARQRASEEHLERLRAGTTVQGLELQRLRVRVNASEERREAWRSGVEARLRSSQEHLERLQTLASEGPRRSLEAAQLESRLSARLDQVVSSVEGAEVRLRSAEERLRLLRSDVEPRLKTAEERLETVKTSGSVQEVEVQSLRWRLNVSEEHLRQLATDVEVRLTSEERRLEELEAGRAAQGSSLDSLALQLNGTGGQLDRLESRNSELSRRLTAAEDRRRPQSPGQPAKVAFSAGLADSGAVGPFDEERTLVFSKTVANEGGAYDPTTGVFTSPRRGVYFFSFTAADFVKGYMGLKLYHNRRPVVFALELNDHGGYAATSGGVALRLEERDQVRLGLPASYRLYDDARNFSFFSGFLLFPL